MDHLLNFLDGSEDVDADDTPMTKEANYENSNNAHKTELEFAEEFRVQSNKKACELSKGTSLGSNRHALSTTMDEHSKLRIVNRVTSRMQLNELLNSHQFHSCTALSAASKATLSTLLIKPSASNDLSGKTNLATIAILFQNSGTKMSNKGSAYTIFTLGDFTTGTLISLFLFGDAYSAYNNQSKKILNGTVLAILSPTMLKSKPGSDTSLTLSVSQTDQIAVVGKAQDYGTCAGVCWVKRNGISSESKCKQYVDLRVSSYCSLHAKQRFQKKGKDSIPTMQNKRSLVKSSNLSFVQKMKTEKKNRSTPINANVKSNMGVASSLSRNLPQHKSQSNAILSKLRAPMHMKKETSNNVTQMQCRTKRNLTDFLNETETKSNEMLGRGSKPKRKIARGEGFDGDVCIPKPSFLFKSWNEEPNSIPSHKNRSVYDSSLLESSNTVKERVLFKQRQLLERLKESKKKITGGIESFSSRSSSSLHDKNKSIKKRHESNGKTLNSSPSNSKANNHQLLKTNLLFDNFELSQAQQQKVRSSSSKYCMEATAETFAESRKKLIELQRKELSQTSTKKNDKNKNAIRAEYECISCRKKFSMKPMYCIKSRHVVKLRRYIDKKHLTVREMRLKKNDPNGNNDGMILAAGLEWSGWKGC